MKNIKKLQLKLLKLLILGLIIKKKYEYKVRYKHRLAWHWVPATVIENDPRYQDLLIKFNKSIRKH